MQSFQVCHFEVCSLPKATLHINTHREQTSAERTPLTPPTPPTTTTSSLSGVPPGSPLFGAKTERVGEIQTSCAAAPIRESARNLNGHSRACSSHRPIIIILDLSCCGATPRPSPPAKRVVVCLWLLLGVSRASILSARRAPFSRPRFAHTYTHNWTRVKTFAVQALSRDRHSHVQSHSRGWPSLAYDSSRLAQYEIIISLTHHNLPPPSNNSGPPDAK